MTKKNNIVYKVDKVDLDYILYFLLFIVISLVLVYLIHKLKKQIKSSDNKYHDYESDEYLDDNDLNISVELNNRKDTNESDTNESDTNKNINIDINKKNKKNNFDLGNIKKMVFNDYHSNRVNNLKILNKFNIDPNNVLLANDNLKHI